MRLPELPPAAARGLAGFLSALTVAVGTALIERNEGERWSASPTLVWVATVLTAWCLRGGMELRPYRRIAWVAFTRENMFRGSCWVATIGTGYLVEESLRVYARQFWTGSALQSVAPPLAVLVGILVGIAGGLILHAAPGELRQACAKGYVSETTARDVLAVGALTWVLQFFWVSFGFFMP